MSKLHKVFLFKISFSPMAHAACMEGGELPVFMDLKVGVTAILCLSNLHAVGCLSMLSPCMPHAECVRAWRQPLD
jgi:hypothetical protein